MAELEGEDLTAALAKFKAKSKSNTAAARHAADKKSNIAPTDGRRLRATGITRDAQINFKIPKDMKREIFETARELGVPMVWILERGFELVKEEAAKAAKDKKGGQR